MHLNRICQVDYPAACNAAETLLVHEARINDLWPKIAKSLTSESVTLLCDSQTLAAVHESEYVRKAGSDDFGKEHLALTISVRTVSSCTDAVRYINATSSHHTDSIITRDKSSSSFFCRNVDSAGVFVNASTRFADGFRYGFGTEVGISTGKIHARGPVGLEGLMIYKYILRSAAEGGHITSEFGTEGGRKPFIHVKPKHFSQPYE